MITSIFNKSKPINFIIVTVAVIFLFAVTNYKGINFEFLAFTDAICRIFIALFTIFILDFIISKNNLTKHNSYAIMTLGLCFFIFPEVLRYLDLLVSNLFVLFALRRLISLQSKLNIKKKLFDAAFWIGLATFFYVWSILFFLIIIVALIYYWQKDVKNIAVPFLGLLTIIVLLLSYNILFKGAYLDNATFKLDSSLDFTGYNSLSQVIRLTIVASVYIWCLVFYFKNIGDKNKKVKPAYFFIAWTSVIAILIALIAPVKDGSEFVFLLVPFSIVFAAYLETILERWFKEVFVSLLIVIPIAFLVL